MLNISGIHEGFVLDHIKAGMSLQIYRDLKLDKLDCTVAIIKNAKSSKMPHGQHRLPHPWRQQVWQQQRQPGAEVKVSGTVRMGADHALLHPAGLCLPQRQDLPRPETVVLSAGSGWNAEIIFDNAKAASQWLAVTPLFFVILANQKSLSFRISNSNPWIFSFRTTSYS